MQNKIILRNTIEIGNLFQSIGLPVQSNEKWPLNIEKNSIAAQKRLFLIIQMENKNSSVFLLN